MSGYKQQVEEMLASIDVAADFEDSLPSSGGRRTWVAVKMVCVLLLVICCLFKR